MFINGRLNFELCKFELWEIGYSEEISRGRKLPFSLPHGEISEFSIEDAVEKIFPHCAEKIYARGIFIADGLRWFAALSKFATTLVIKQNFMPSIEDGVPRWISVLYKNDAEIFEKFVRALPKSINYAENLAKNALNLFLDAIIRKTHPKSEWINLPITDSLVERVRVWQKPIILRTQSKFNFKISLVEPKKIPQWKIRCSIDENDKNNEAFMHAVARASRIAPALAPALRDKNMTAPVSFETLANFVNVQALELEGSGFEFVRPWWNDPTTRDPARVKLRAVVTPIDDGERNFNAKTSVEWKPILNGKELSPLDLQSLLEVPVVQINGKFALISKEEIENALEFLKKPKKILGAHEILRISLEKDFEVVAQNWLGELLERLRDKIDLEILTPPNDFAGLLRPYQARGFSWIDFMTRHGLGACLADDMGLGKTVQTIAFITSSPRCAVEPPVLLICPTSLIENWRREIERFAPHLRVFVHHGLAREKGANFTKKCFPSDIVITSYALASRDKFIGYSSWRGIILDEAQNIKNPETAQTKAVHALRGDWRLVLTGTPVENHVGDLWSLMQFLNPSLLGTWGEYNRLYVKEFKKTQDTDILDKVKRLTSPFILRRLKTDKSIISDLPEKVETKEFCELTDEQIELYKSVTGGIDELDDVTGIKRRGMVLSILLRLKQICNHPVQYLQSIDAEGFSSALENRSGKLERLGEIIEEVIESREKMLIFSQFAGMAEIIQKYISRNFGEECLLIHGKVSRIERDALVRRFQKDERGARFFALTMKTGGTGLNLTRASQVVLFDRWWNPAVEQQAIDRAFRIGQTKNVQVRSFVCSKTLEDWIDELIDGKKKVAGRVVTSGEEWLAKLSTTELKKVLEYGVKR